MVSREQPSVILTVNDLRAATFQVCGLTVLERNILSLKQAGFAPLIDSSQRGHRSLGEIAVKHSISFKGPVPAQGVTLNGCCQYPLAFFARLKRGKMETRECLDMGRLLERNSPDQVKQILETSLFDEIHRNTQGWIARHLNKKISFFITRLLVKTKISPNQITCGCFFVGLSGCLCFLSHTWLVRVAGAFLIQLNSILDGCDGEVARLKVMRSRLGAWLDTISDDVLNNVMFVCLFAGYLTQFPNVGFFKLCILTTMASLGMSFFLYHYLVTHQTPDAGRFRLSWQKSDFVQGPSERSLFDLVKPVLKRDFVIFAVMILVILDLRIVLSVLFVPIWGAFFLYMISFFHSFAQPGALYGESSSLS